MLHESIVAGFPSLNADQREAIGHQDGPLLIIAGPGSGKTLVLVLRTLNLLLTGAARPQEIALCTFTEKAAFELRDRLLSAAKRAGYTGDLTQLRVGTIHSLCSDYLSAYKQFSSRPNGFTMLDELTQRLFIGDHDGEVIGDRDEEGSYLGRWKGKWQTIQRVIDYSGRIAEELIDPKVIVDGSQDSDLQAIARAVVSYHDLLETHHCLDFAHLQTEFLRLLNDSEAGPKILDAVKYVMVDEYQDTNYVQERIVRKLAERTGNLCVVGDEDQALYRFRGATVRNILEFAEQTPGCHSITLSTNYRSHPAIIAACNRFMQVCDWRNRAGGPSFRFDKTIAPDPGAEFPAYPSVFSIYGATKVDEAGRFAELVKYLKVEGIIEDYNQVALLLRSVISANSHPFIEALQAKGIPAHCPRARGYFDTEEIQLIVACFALVLGYHGDGRGEIRPAQQPLVDYIDVGLTNLAQRMGSAAELVESIRVFANEIEGLNEGESLDRRPADFLYAFLACEPFLSFLDDEARARNLAIFSKQLIAFQNYYHYPVISFGGRDSLRYKFFGSFLQMLFTQGVNEYEDDDDPFPKGRVQIMTIHQAKGLEFPVVVVGSLSTNINAESKKDRELQPFMQRPPFEPFDRFSEFDRMRLHYVAFSRAQRVLVLTADEQPKSHFRPIFDGLEQWPYVRKDLLAALNFRLRDREPIKKTFSFTGHVKMYETCPRQYQVFRFLDFAPARSAEYFFGSLVHESIERIHRWTLQGQSKRLIENAIPTIVDEIYAHLITTGLRPIGEDQKERAKNQVLRYFKQNKDLMDRVIETEVDVSVEKERYILTGKIDLLMASDQKLELLDFKSQKRPQDDGEMLHSYHLQLCVYAHILEHRYQKRPDRLLLYWTGEERREDALMQFQYEPSMVEAAGSRFDAVVAKILARDFAVTRPPERSVCEDCDMRHACSRQGIIRPWSRRQRSAVLGG